MRKYFTLGLIGVLMIVLTQSAVPPLTRQAHAEKKLPEWVTYEGKSVLEDQNCRETALKCYNLPRGICTPAATHPTVCTTQYQNTQGIILIEQLPIGFCSSPVEKDGVPEITTGCIRYDSIKIAKAHCFHTISQPPGQIIPSCYGYLGEVFCTYHAGNNISWVCVPGYIP